MRKHYLYLLYFSISWLIIQTATAQELPPRPMQVTTWQNMNFGAFIGGQSGGTITLLPGGDRTATGTVFPVFMGFNFEPAIFEVEALPGNIIHINLPVSSTLTGSNGGSLILSIAQNQTSPLSPFVNTINPPFKMQVRVGGTLTIGSPSEDPAGNYTGTFAVTFMQE